MAIRMRLTGTRNAPLRVRAAGSALLVYPKGGEDSRPVEFMARRAIEPGQTVVGLDIDPETPPEEFEGILDELASCPGTLRLVPVRSGAASTLNLGAWLAERCGRTVLAYEGTVHTVVGGGMYVPPAAGAGWLRLEPGSPPVPHSRRFPRPRWECDLFDEQRSLGPRIVVEPLPAGVWIRPYGDSPTTRAYRGLLFGSLLPDLDLPRVVLGYPGAPVGPLSNLADYWGRLPADLRPAVRFARFGPSDGVAEPFGQALADAVDAPVIVSTGVRLLVPDRADGLEARTLLPEGTMSWVPYADDFGYMQSRATGGVPADPVPIGHRAPIAGLAQQRHGVYEYGEDALLEVTQSGLWMRPANEPPNGDWIRDVGIRTVPPDPGHAKVFFDDGDLDTAARLQVLAQEAVARLEPQAREAARLLAASTAAESTREPRLESGPAPAPELAMPAAPEPETRIEPDPDPEPTLELELELEHEPEPESEPTLELEPEPHVALEPEAVLEPEPEAVLEPEPELPVVLEPEPEPELEPEPEPEPVAFSRPQLVSSPVAAFETPDVLEALTTTKVQEPAPEPPTPVAAPAPIPVTVPAQSTPQIPPTPPTPPTPPAPPAAPRSTPSRPAKTGPQVQPVPSAQATAIPPTGGIAEERVWLRRNLNKQYDATASSVARVLSEYPGLRAGTGASDSDVLTDLVAVRLYLDGKTRNLDDAVRAATVGPHVPLARCVAAGLRRLPSFRGVARLRAELNEAEWLWYSGNELVTEWSFSPVLTSGRFKLPGDVDILIWSMTARRINLIDPVLRDQAVFLPGTRFKRLRVGSGASREIYLRELAQTEVAADGTVHTQQPLDQIALTALEQAAEVLRLDEPAEDLDVGHADRFGSPPGLIGRPASVSSRNGHSNNGHSNGAAASSSGLTSSPDGAASMQEAGRAV
jgi:hypothetical protein